jgi:hypothetical protein
MIHFFEWFDNIPISNGELIVICLIALIVLFCPGEQND